MRRDEVPHLTVAVSLLHKFEKVDSVWDWEVGTHGINISFEDPETGRTRHATYLPEVAPEQGWNRREALDSLIAKAGYDGRVTEALLESCRVERYQSSKEKMTHREYLLHRGEKSRPN